MIKLKENRVGQSMELKALREDLSRLNKQLLDLSDANMKEVVLQNVMC